MSWKKSFLKSLKRRGPSAAAIAVALLLDRPVERPRRRLARVPGPIQRASRAAAIQPPVMPSAVRAV
ncbi:MAG TPA: hypothetical protein VFO08_18740 [Methylomirabilota bacterium]|nr:hypothetical protein [Methylomirabilota bacterium]